MAPSFRPPLECSGGYFSLRGSLANWNIPGTAMIDGFYPHDMRKTTRLRHLVLTRGNSASNLRMPLTTLSSGPGQSKTKPLITLTGTIPDLATLSEHLMAVVQETMQPAYVSL